MPHIFACNINKHVLVYLNEVLITHIFVSTCRCKDLNTMNILCIRNTERKKRHRQNIVHIYIYIFGGGGRTKIQEHEIK